MWAVDWLLPGCLVITLEDTDFFAKTRLLFAWCEMENIYLQSKNWAPLSHTFQKAQLLRRPLPWKTKGNFCNVPPEQLPGDIWCSIYVFATTNQLTGENSVFPKDSWLPGLRDLLHLSVLMDKHELVNSMLKNDWPTRKQNVHRHQVLQTKKHCNARKVWTSHITAHQPAAFKWKFLLLF